MTPEEIYWYGVLVAYLVGIAGLAYDEPDNECNITKPECSFFAVSILALLSWMAVVVLLGINVYDQRKK